MTLSERNLPHEPSWDAVRLLPGDRAPPVKLSVPLNRDELPDFVFDRPTVMVLWNAGCAVCHGAIKATAALADEFGVACLGVAIMVRDVERTRSVAMSLQASCLLAVEQRSDIPSPLSRGWLTRRWLEAAGQSGVPAAFVVDALGCIAWIGHPDELRTILPKVLSDEIDRAAERLKWRSSISDGDVRSLAITRDLTEASVTGDLDACAPLIAAADIAHPEANSYLEYAILKLGFLCSQPESQGEAARYYADCAGRFATDDRARLRLGECVIGRTTGDPGIVTAAVGDLHAIDRRWAQASANDHADIFARLRMNIVLANGLLALSAPAEASSHVANLRAIIATEEVSPPLMKWVEAEIDRMSSAIDDARAARDQAS